MNLVVITLTRAWKRVPMRWRRKALVLVATLVMSRLVILIWGPGIWIAVLLLISFGGAILRSYGFRNARHADALLGNVWDYFRGAILVALIPALWPVLQAFRDGDLISGVIQLLLLGLIAATVIEQFNQLPRKWRAMSIREAKPRASRRGIRRRSQRS